MDEEAALKAEIAKLSGAISSHKHTSTSASSSGGYYPPHYRGRGRGRGASTYPYPYRGGGAGPRGRGRGRGAPPPARNRTLILNHSTTKTPNSASAASAPAAPAAPAPIATYVGASSGWSKASVDSKSTAAAPTKKPRSKVSNASIRRGDNMGEVVIDGVVFEFDPSGTKLVKRTAPPRSDIAGGSGSNETPTPSVATPAPSATSATPLRTSINGQAYVRTKRGNLVSAELVARRRAQKEAQAKLRRLTALGKQIGKLQGARYASGGGGGGGDSKRPNKRGGNMSLDNAKPKGLCAYFNKSGQCKRGLSCPFTHDASNISLCPRALRPQGCPLPPSTCPLSHNPTPERVPHCVHYLRSGQCRNGDDCVYTHSDHLVEGLATKICADFSRLGWCDRGKDCTERHTWECPDFAEKGRCDKKGCRLLHVIRAKGDREQSRRTGGGGAGSLETSVATGNERDEDEAGQMQDGDLFMRDDIAADEDEDKHDDEEEHAGKNASKRKRPLLEGQEKEDDDDDDAYECGAAIDGEEVDFSADGASRRKRSKAFSGQKDFISFTDDEGEEDDEEDSEGEEDEDEEDEDIGSDEEVEDHESVNSEDIDVSVHDIDEEGEDHGAIQADDGADEIEGQQEEKVQYIGDDDENDDQLVDSFL